MPDLACGIQGMIHYWRHRQLATMAVFGRNLFCNTPRPLFWDGMSDGTTKLSITSGDIHIAMIY